MSAVLHAPGGFELPPLPEPLGTGQAATSRSAVTYWDSADLALAAAGSDLHHDGRTWTLTGPGEPVTVDGPGDGVPDALRDRLHVQLRSRTLLATARLDTVRVTRPLLRGEHRLGEIVVDHVVAHRDGATLREFDEVAVHCGVRAVRAAVEEQLRAAGCVAGPPASPLLWAVGVLSRPVPAVLPSLDGRQASLRSVVRAAAGGAFGRIAAHDAGARLGEDIEHVHQLRVAARRLRSDLRALGPLLQPAVAAQLRDELAWLGSLAGPVRDADVLRARLRAQVAAMPAPDPAGGAALAELLETQRRIAREAMLIGLRSARYDLLLDAVAATADSPAFAAGVDVDRPAGPMLATLTVAQWKSLRRAVDRLPDEPSIAALHRIRIHAKRVRYVAETAAPVLGRPAARVAAAATAIQTLLGDLHDAVVAEQWLRDAVGAVPAGAFAAGELIALEHARAERLRGEWAGTWPRRAAEAAPAVRKLRKRR